MGGSTGKGKAKVLEGCQTHIRTEIARGVKTFKVFGERVGHL